MIACPRCFTEFEGLTCPECGTEVAQKTSGMLKTSAIFISAAGEQGFYRSVQEVPEPLRQQLLKVTASENSGTIVIADRAGRDRLTHIVARRESASCLPGKQTNGGRASGALLPHASFLGFSWIIWAGAGLLAASAAVIAAAFAIRW
jgi:hypothetical protein